MFAFADADHDAGFGDGALGFDAGEEFHGAFVLGAGADGGVATVDGFEVVGDDFWFGVDDHLEGCLVAFEVADEDFDGHVGACFSGSQNSLCPDACAPVGEVVAVDGGDDDVFESCTAQGFGDSSWFVFVDGCGFAGFDIAEATGAGAGVAEDHDGGDTFGPAFAHVWAGGFLANGVEIVGVDGGFGGLEVFTAWEFGFEPAWFLFDGEVVEGVVLVVEDHGVEGEGGFEGGDGVASEGAGVALEGARMPGIAGFLVGLR